MATGDEAGAWFAAIAGWTRVQQRVAVVAGAAFALLVVGAPLAWLSLPPALTMASVPSPSWSGRGFRSGALMRDFERHCKQSSWLTFFLRGWRNEIAWEFGALEPADVVRGLGDWLFLRNTVAWDAEAVAAAAPRRRAVFAAAKAWARDHGVELLVLPAPDKSTIYPEHVPEGVLPAGRARLYDAILEDLAASGLPAIDLRAHLLAAKATPGATLLYHPGDTHWTQSAKAHVAAAVATWLRDQRPALVLPLVEHLVVAPPATAPFVPDLVRMLGFRIAEGQPPAQLPLHLQHFVEVGAWRAARFVEATDSTPLDARQDRAFVALCGSSYSAGFAPELMAALGTVVDARGALSGGGSFRGLRTLMAAFGQQGFTPRLVLWEFVEREYLGEWLRVESLQEK